MKKRGYKKKYQFEINKNKFVFVIDYSIKRKKNKINGHIL